MNKCREKTVNTKTTELNYGPTISDMRMSRLSHPRASMFAMILLAVVFLLFGLFASAVEPGYSATPDAVNGALTVIGDWASFDAWARSGEWAFSGEWARLGDWVLGHSG